MESAGFNQDEIRDAVYAAGHIDSPTQTGTWMDQLSPQEHGVATSLKSAGFSDQEIKDHFGK